MFLSLVNVIHAAKKEDFITTWQTIKENESITIPTNPKSKYDYNINWGDGTNDKNIDKDATHTYKSPGTYKVIINGTFPHIFFNNKKDKNKIISIDQWGTGAWTNMGNAFKGCSKLILNATDTPNLSQCTSLNYTFASCNIIGKKGNWNWDTSNITTMAWTFNKASFFNGRIGGWNTSNVKNMSGMFAQAMWFSRHIVNWNTKNVTNLSYMFMGTLCFSKNLNKWDTKNVTDITAMFINAKSFDGDISEWNVTNIRKANNFIKGKFSTKNYNKLLIGWSKQKLQKGVILNVGTVQYSKEAAKARETMISVAKWDIKDGGLAK